MEVSGVLKQIRDLLAQGFWIEANREARRLIEDVDELRERDTPQAAAVLELVVRSSLELGNAGSETEEFARRVVGIRESHDGDKSSAYLESLTDLGTVLRRATKYDECFVIYEKAIKQIRTIGGTSDIRLVRPLNGLGRALADCSRFEDAKAALEEARILLVGIGDRGLLMSETLYNLAMVHKHLYDLERAETLYRMALEIDESILGSEHPRIAVDLNALGACLFDNERMNQALPVYERSIAILSAHSLPGQEHPDLAFSHNNLAWVLEATGQLAEAKCEIEKAIAIHERQAAGAVSPHAVGARLTLARLERRLGRLIEARTQAEDAVGAFEALFGPQHQDSLIGRGELAEVLFDLRDSGALSLALEVEAAGREHLCLLVQSMQEREALAYAAKRPGGLRLLLSACTESGGIPADMVRRVWDALIRSRGIVFDEMVRRQQLSSRSRDPAVNAAYGQLATARRDLADLAIRGVQDHSVPLEQQVRIAMERREVAERECARVSRAFREDRVVGATGFEEMALALPRRTALVAYCCFPLRWAPGEVQVTGSRYRYLAFVLRGGEAEPCVIPIGEAVAIDAEVARWRDEIESTVQDGARRQAGLGKAGNALRERLWDPLASFVEGVESIFVVPDGQLHRVNLLALSAGSRYLVELIPPVHYLGSERDLVVRRTAPRRSMVVMGSPDFDAIVGSPVHGRDHGKDGEVPQWLSLMELPGFGALRSSEGEVAEVAAAWERRRLRDPDDVLGAQVFTGFSASKSNFLANVGEVSHIHLCTHGFALSEDSTATASDPALRGISLRRSQRGGAEDQALANPLLRCGLVLAGANVPGQNGILTGEEIAVLDLHGVELAVLSACDTGLGQIAANEGVIGLGRAFKVAGVGTVILGLWKVGDAATREWMAFFYEEHLTNGAGVAVAVHRASQAVLETRVNRGEGRDPRFWAGFIGLGTVHDQRPVSKSTKNDTSA